MSMESLLNWGGPGYPSYDGELNAAVVTPPVSSGAPVASPTTTPTPTPVPSTGTGAPTATPTVTAPTNDNAENIAVLRQSHENLRSLGVDFNTAKEYTSTMAKLASEGSTLAQKLGYTAESFKAAWADDPVGTLHVLRQEAQQAANRSPDPNAEAIRQAVDQRVAPLNEFVARQQAERHNQFIDSEFNTALDAHPVLKSIKDPDVRADLHDRYIETVKWNNGVLKEVMEGKSSGLKKVFDEVVNNWIKVQNAYLKTTGQPAPAGVNSGPANQGGNGAAKFNLDDVIEGNDNAVAALPSMRGWK